MNSYRLSDLSVGVTEQFSVAVTGEMLETFHRLSGDDNPLHNDEDYAKARGFQSRVVFGMLCASLFSTLAGVYLPGEYCLLHELNTKFKRPVYVGDTLTISGAVTEKSEALRRVTVKAKITNQNGVVVNKATIKAGVLE